MPLPNVDPGDLIRSADWNSMVATINALEVRVAELEGGGSGKVPRIDEVLPTGIVTAGDTIRIFGANFDFTNGGHSVFFGDTRAIVFLAGSSNTLLIVKVPDVVEGATEAGNAMTMKVGNLVGVATRAITIKAKPVVTSGGIAFSFKSTRPTATPTANAQFFYDFELKSTASQDLTVTLTPTVTIIPPLPAGVPDPQLQTRIAVLDSDGTVRANGQVSLPEGATKTVSLRLSLPTGTNGVRYNLSATATAPGVADRVESLPAQQVGQASEQPDSTITSFEFSSSIDGRATFNPDPGGVTGADGTIAVAPGQTGVIDVRAMFANIPVGTTNNYAITAAIEGTANGWSTKVNETMQNPQPVPGPGGAVAMFFDITAPSTPAQAVLRLTLTRQGAVTNNKRSVAYRLILR